MSESDLNTEYSNGDEYVSYLSHKTKNHFKRHISYRSNADKPYQALKKYLKSNAKDFKYTKEANPSSYFSETYTNGNKTFSIQYSPSLCYFFVSHGNSGKH